MMNRTLIAMVAVATMAFGALGDARNQLVSFYSNGPDKYADGTTVLDGEWYALVWSKDGTFEGFTPQCGPVDKKDLVVLMAPLAKDGHCPYSVFQVDSKSDKYKANGDGVYAVYLLDTRNADKSSPSVKGESGLPANVDGAVALAAGGSTGVVAVASAEWNESSVDESAEGYDAPKISAIKVEGAKVRLTVTGLLPSVKYNVRMGGKVDSLDTFALETPALGATEADFVVTPEDSRFFKVTRQPLERKETK